MQSTFFALTFIALFLSTASCAPLFPSAPSVPLGSYDTELNIAPTPSENSSFMGSGSSMSGSMGGSSSSVASSPMSSGMSSSMSTTPSSSGTPSIEGAAVCPEGERQCVVKVSYLPSTYAACFDSKTYKCVENLLCHNTTPKRCGDACFSSDFYVCLNNNFLCPSNLNKKCGEACYDPAVYGCHNEELFELSEGLWML